MIITFSTSKGGGVKTTGAVATAGLLARHYRVGIADFDPDAYTTVMGLGQAASLDPLSEGAIRISHPLLERGELWLHPGGDAIDSASEAELASHLTRCASAVDFLIIDTPPDRRRPTVVSALRAADIVVIPVVPEYQGLAGLEKLMDTCRALQIRAKVRALRSRWEANTVLGRDVERDLVTSHPDKVISVAIPKDQRAAEAPAAGLPVTLYAPRCPASLAYRTAVYEIAATGGIHIPKGAI